MEKTTDDAHLGKVETPVSGGGPDKGAPDGVSASPDPEGDVDIQGRPAGGESGGGAYPNPHTGKPPSGGGFMGHGGQTEIVYHGGGQIGKGGDAPNAATGSDSSNGAGRGAAPPKAPTYEARAVGGGAFAVKQTNGIAQAEATGKVVANTPFEEEPSSPGSG